MAWSDEVARLHLACLAEFGIPAIFTPQDGSGNQTITGIIQEPGMFEDNTPGGIPGAAVVRLFVRFAAITPAPQHGDSVTVNGSTYVVGEIEADTQGGAVLKLRIT